MPVLDFETAKFIRDNRHLVNGGYDLDINWNDVTRYTRSEMLAPGDPIKMGEQTRQKIATVFPAFGLPPDPRTWGQLEHNLNYCQQLIALSMGAAYGQSMPSIIRGAETWKPGWGVRVKALVEGDLATLAQLHREADTFRLNGLREDDKRSTAA